MSQCDLNTTCYFCGKVGSDTVEDIPPRSFFPDGQRQGILRIPAHLSCNQGWSKTVEYFRNVFSGLSPGVPAAKNLYETKGKRSFTRSPKLREKMLSELKKNIPVYSPGGIYLGSHPGVIFDKDHAKIFVEHMIRGLYFYHKKIPLPETAEILYRFQPRMDSPEIIHSLPIIEIHPQVFKYRYLFEGEESVSSIWLLGFYDVGIGTILAHTTSGESNVEGPK